MKIQPIIVAFNSHLWIQQAISTFLRHHPDEHILVVNNNPPRSLNVEGHWSYDDSSFDWSRLGGEEDWLKSHDRLTVIESPSRRTHTQLHGDGLNLARQWCMNNGKDAMFHFEPDCLFHGSQLMEHAQRKLNEGCWLVGHKRWWRCGMWTAGTTWRLDTPLKRFNFLPQPIGWDSGHERFDEICPNFFDKRRGAWRTCWDTGQKIWFESELENRVIAAEDHMRDCGMRHYFGGSIKRPPLKIL